MDTKHNQMNVIIIFSYQNNTESAIQTIYILKQLQVTLMKATT